MFLRMKTTFFSFSLLIHKFFQKKALPPGFAGGKKWKIIEKKSSMGQNLWVL